MNRHQSSAGGQRGFALVVFALVLVTLLVFTAFVTDLGLVYLERRVDQNAADAAVTSGAVVIVQTGGDLQAAVDEIVAEVDANLNRTLSSAAWTTCVDTGALALTAADLGLAPPSGCISFTSGFDGLRVRTPDQTVQAAFGQVVGVDEHAASAFAESAIAPVGGGALPFVALSTSGPGDQICLRTRDTNEEPPDQLGFDPYTERQPDPCNEANFLTSEGGRGTILPYFYDDCSKPTGNKSIAAAIMVGMDHLLGVFDPEVVLAPGDSAAAYDPPFAGSRLDGDASCGVAFPNTIDVDTGLSQSMLHCALLEEDCAAAGNSRINDGRLRESGSSASFTDEPVNDNALWDFFVDPLPVTASDACVDADDDDAEFYFRRAAMQACLATWASGDGVLFTSDIADDARFGYVPRVAEIGLCNTQPDPDDIDAECSGQPLDNIHVNSFSPIYIDGLYEFRNPAATNVICDSDNLSTVDGETLWTIHYPGKGLDCGSSGANSVDRLSGLVLVCGALPPDVCDATSNPPFPSTLGIIRVELTR